MTSHHLFITPVSVTLLTIIRNTTSTLDVASANMTRVAAKFTPDVLLEAPRRSEGLPNSDASKVLYSVSTYSFAEHAKKSEIRLLDVANQQTSLVTDNKSASEPVWIDDETIVLLVSEDDGTTSVVVGDPSDFEKR